jgi:hypothetical protein
MDDGTDWLILIVGILLGLGILYLVVATEQIKRELAEARRRALAVGRNERLRKPGEPPVSP